MATDPQVRQMIVRNLNVGSPGNVGTPGNSQVYDYFTEGSVLSVEEFVTEGSRGAPGGG